MYRGDDFYYDAVAPKMMEIGKEFDRHLDRLRKSKGLIIDGVSEILGVHKYLMDAFYKITGLEKTNSPPSSAITLTRQ